MRLVQGRPALLTHRPSLMTSPLRLTLVLMTVVPPSLLSVHATLPTLTACHPSNGLIHLLRTIDIQPNFDILTTRNRNIAPGRRDDDRLATGGLTDLLAQVNHDHKLVSLYLERDILHRPPPFSLLACYSVTVSTLCWLTVRIASSERLIGTFHWYVPIISGTYQ